MAKKRNRTINKIKRVRTNKTLWNTGAANTFEKFLLATLITGIATGFGVIVGNVISKYVLQKIDKSTNIIPQALKGEVWK